MRNHLQALALASALGSLLGTSLGCGNPPTFLDGSIKTSHDLSFDAVELRYLTDQTVFQLSYFKNLDEEAGAAAGQDTVVKVTFTTALDAVVAEKPIDLLAPAAAGRVERITAADDPFPTDLESGTVTFLNAPVVDETVKGELAITFANGKTLNGAFETPLVEVSFQ